MVRSNPLPHIFSVKIYEGKSMENKNGSPTFKEMEVNLRLELIRMGFGMGYRSM